MFSIIVFSSEIYAGMRTTIISKCYEGDIWKTIDGEKIRLVCIDTPEIKKGELTLLPLKKQEIF